MAESISDVIRGAASVTVVVAVPWTVRLRHAEIVLARVAASHTAGWALHKVVFSTHGSLVRQRYVLVNVEGFLRSAAISGETLRGCDRRWIVSCLPLRWRRKVVRQIIQLLGCQFRKRAERIDLGLERQLANVHKPVAIVVLPMDA